MSSTTLIAEPVSPPLKLRPPDPYLPREVWERLRAAEAEARTEDNQPVDNMLSERQMHLLFDALHSSWKPTNPKGEPRRFFVIVNVGIYFRTFSPPIVPDVALVMDAELTEGYQYKNDLTYFAWDYGKVPDVVIEIVSNDDGGEDTSKLEIYEEIGVKNYVIFDPLLRLSDEMLRFYRLTTEGYKQTQSTFFPRIGLGVKVWPGTFGEKKYDQWLRWCDKDGTLIPTGAEQQQRAAREAERAEREAERAEREAERAEREAERAEREAERAEKLAARLREMGLDPETP
jgi:Uma2 family endonuclease